MNNQKKAGENPNKQAQGSQTYQDLVALVETKPTKIVAKYDNKNSKEGGKER
jgi:hypothetical protein